MFPVEKIREDFPMLKNNPELIYFDNGATTFKPQCVIDAISEYYTHKTCNIHRGDYDLSFQVSAEYEAARQVVRDFIGAKEDQEIVFTAGASAALNLVAYGYGQKFLKEGDVVLSSEAEHASSILPWFKACEVTKAKLEYIPLTERGELTIENLKTVLNDRVKVIALANVTNVLGYPVPIKEICRLAHEIGAVVVCDGAQAVPHIPVDVTKWDVDFLAFSAHKLCGPTGVGVLYGRYSLLEQMDPFLLGGGSNARFDMCGNIKLKNAPYKFEAGTPAIEAVLGMAKAIEYVSQIGMSQISAYEEELKRYCVEKLEKLDNVILYNADSPTGLVAFNIKGVFAQDAASYLNSKKIAVRSGNHCAKILMEVLKTSETIRASFCFYNTKEEVDALIQAVSEITLENCIGLFF